MAGSLALVVVFAAAALCLLVSRSVWRRRPDADDDWLPAELRGAELQWSERLFRLEGQVPISARIDRAYRSSGGGLVLVEFKRRALRRVHLSDVVELSAQRYVLAHAGYAVSRRAYVVVVLPDGARTSAFPVDLEDAAQVELRAARLKALIELRSAPRGAHHAALCAGCGYRGACPLARR
ncbi:MAG TPA: PD-(D/E)XK nuclease family protein [Aquabacterium sp.]|nr:PD-(D/E)XK nuclease family protein [Aquabacterium sp.]